MDQNLVKTLLIE